MDDSNEAIDALLEALGSSEDLAPTSSSDVLEAENLVSEADALGLIISDDEESYTEGESSTVISSKTVDKSALIEPCPKGIHPLVVDSNGQNHVRSNVRNPATVSSSLIDSSSCVPPPSFDYLSSLSLFDLEDEISRLENRLKLLRLELKKRKSKSIANVETNLKNEPADRAKPQPSAVNSSSVSNISKVPSHSTSSDLHGRSKPFLTDRLVDFSIPTPDSRDELEKYDSAVHAGLSDSSDDEQMRNPMEDDFRHLSDPGRALKKQLRQSSQPSQFRTDADLREKAKRVAKSFSVPTKSKPHESSQTGACSSTLYADYDSFFRIRVLTPLVPSTTFNSIVGERLKIRLSDLRVKRKAAEEQEWVTMGVVVEKFPPKVSANGSNFAIFRISDLIDCNASVKLFLFGNCYKQLWKISAGSVFALLNPSVMESKGQSKADEVCLKFDNPDQLMELGMSRDMGFCQSRRKDKKPCTHFINKESGDVCDYHLTNRAKTLSSKRGELQANTNLAPKSELEKRVFGKGGIATGGRLFTARSQPMITVDELRIHRELRDSRQRAINGPLSKPVSSSSNMSPADNLLKSAVAKQHSLPEMRDSTSSGLLNVIHENTQSAGSRNLVAAILADNDEEQETENQNAPKKTSAPAPKPMTASQFLSSMTQKISKSTASQSPKPRIPRLGRSAEINLDAPSAPTVALDKSKLRALSLVKQRGGLNKIDPNAVPGRKSGSKDKSFDSTSQERDDSGLNGPPALLPCNAAAGVSAKQIPTLSISPAKKRSRLGEIDLNDPAVKKMIAKTSANAAQLTEDELIRQENYFKTMEHSEKVSERMSQLTELKDVQVVTCKQCHYTARGPSSLCLTERHPLVHHRATRRWFKCKHCKQRVEGYDKLPTKPCTHCSCTEWLRVTFKEAKVVKQTEELKIRGDEEKFLH